ncbi:MAG: glycoside hydrolase family 127 protein, partial [Candidatus Hydrogenedentes bacterium]|nr:glycoside hydrolase family 127 protein [Candidatus Hydrogenedentota bacterium]
MSLRALSLVVSMLAAAATAPAAELLAPLAPAAVQVRGEMGDRIGMTIEQNLLALDLEGDFLQPFRERKDTGGFIGLGMLIDAMVRAAAYSGNPDLIARKDHAVEFALATQEPDGYIGIMKPGSRLWSLWDIHEMGYVVLGLTTNYRLFNHAPSRDAAVRLADYIISGWRSVQDPLPGGGEITVYMAITGLESAFLHLGEATGDTKYREFCIQDRELPAWDGPIVLGRWGQIQGHAYAYMSRCLAQLELYEQAPDPALLETSHKVLDFLLQGDGLAITGTCGQHECWHDTQEGAANLGETCATAYLIRWLNALLRIEDNPRYGDLMERAIFNSLFAAQSPDGRKIRYYSPFEGPREYFKGDTYCCPCNYRRIVAELPQFLYYVRDREVTVNLYTASEANIVVDGVPVRLVQETRYPEEGTVTVRVEAEKPVDFALRLRIPGWAANATVAVDQGAPAPADRGAYCTLARRWSSSSITVNFPLTPRLVKGRKAQDGRAALMAGPRVFCLSRSDNP